MKEGSVHCIVLQLVHHTVVTMRAFLLCSALAKNCNCTLDAVNGAKSKDWKAGKPVRVVRSCKGRKHSEFAPEEGNRYDGIYKVFHRLFILLCIYN